MEYDNNYNTGYCSSCGQGGYDYSSCSPDYNPVTVNNSTCPTLDSTSAGGSGGTASGNNSSVCVNVGGCNCSQEKHRECCCKDGVKKLLQYLYKKAVDSNSNYKTISICIYGDIIPTDILDFGTCTNSLLSIPTNENIQITSITDDIVKFPSKGVISICSISVIKFTFDDNNDTNICNVVTDLRRDFFYTPKCQCGCSCDCGDGMAQALYLNGLGVPYNITLQDTLKPDATSVFCQGALDGIQLIAIDSNIAIFSYYTDSRCLYFGVPTCRIAKFTQVEPSSSTI